MKVCFSQTPCILREHSKFLAFEISFSALCVWNQFLLGTVPKAKAIVQNVDYVLLTSIYAYHIPNPKHMPNYTKAKVLCTQDKHAQLSSLAELSCYPIKSLADTNPPEYVDTHLLPTGYLPLKN